MQEQITRLHQLYCSSLGMDLAMNAHFERLWFDALKDGLTEEILRSVIASRKKDVTSGKRYRNSLLLRNLIGSPDVVADLLNEYAMLQASKRAFAPDPKRESVLNATGRKSEPPPSAPRSVREVLKSLKEQS